MEPEVSLPCSQQPETEESSLQTCITINIHFNIILPSKSMSTKCSILSGFPTKTCVPFPSPPFLLTVLLYISEQFLAASAKCNDNQDSAEV